MKNLITASLAIAITLFSFNAMAQLKGPAYKNASVKEKYQGDSKVTMTNNPTELKGPEAKNQKFGSLDKTEPVLTASLNDSNMAINQKKYKVVDVKASESKFDKGLKGPRFKNYRPGK
ncbi:MAG: hypothetical protein ACFHWX_03800 [Bacteroidota bacterium]